MQQQRRQPDQAMTVAGVILVGLGLLFLAQQSLGVDIGRLAWPLFVILPGLAMLVAYALAPRSAAGLAIPGCVITTIGLIPAAVGLGLRLQSEQLGQPRAAC